MSQHNAAKGQSGQPAFVSDQTVQTGQWMFLHEAVEATGLSDKTLRRYVKRRELKARRLGKASNAPVQVWITPQHHKLGEQTPEIADVDIADDDSELVDDFFGVAEETPVDTVAGTAPLGDSGSVQELVQVMTRQFVEKLDEEKRLIFQLQRELDDKDRQLRLLPDLQKQTEEVRKTAELKELEVEALKKQIEAMEAETKSAVELEKELATLKHQVEELRRPWWKWWLGVKAQG